MWLNTCVGTRNYFAFFSLIFFAAVTYLWQIISMALLLTVWWTPDVKNRGAQVFGSSNGLFAVSIVNICLAFPIGGFYFGLFLFHCYLQVENTTTYGWKMHEATKRREAKKAAGGTPSALKSGLPTAASIEGEAVGVI